MMDNLPVYNNGEWNDPSPQKEEEKIKEKGKGKKEKKTKLLCWTSNLWSILYLS